MGLSSGTINNKPPKYFPRLIQEYSLLFILFIL
jgi:hypothetical protein